MRKVACLTLLLGLLIPFSVTAFEAEIEALAKDLARSLDSEATTTLAVIDFRDLEGTRTSLGRFLSEQLAIQLLGAGGFELFSRSELARLADEIQLSEEGLVSPESTKRLELEGVDVLVTGTVTELGKAVLVSVQALRTSTARVVAAATTRIAVEGELTELAGRRLYDDKTNSQVSSSQLVLPGAQRTGPFEVALSDFKVLGDAKALQAFRSSKSGVVVSATFDVLNQSKRNLLFGLADIEHGTSASDNRSNFCEVVGGLEAIYSWSNYADRALSIGPNGRVRPTIIFRCTGAQPKAIGDRFSVTWSMTTFDVENKQTGNFAVSFRDVVARSAGSP